MLYWMKHRLMHPTNDAAGDSEGQTQPEGAKTDAEGASNPDTEKNPTGGDEAQTRAAEGTQTGKEDDTTKAQGEETPGKTFTQQDVNRVGAREKEEGRRSVLSKLGIDLTQYDSTDKAVDKLSKDFPKLVEDASRVEEMEILLTAVKCDAVPTDENLNDLVAIAKARVKDGNYEEVFKQLKTIHPSMYNSGQAQDDKGTGGNIGGKPQKEDKSKDPASDIGKRLAEKALAKNKSAQGRYFQKPGE